MNTDFRISVGFFGHIKTKKLARRLGEKGVLALLKLWEYAAQFKPDGDFSGLSNEDIEIAADWNADAALMPSLTSCGFVDGEEGEYQLHDWKEHNSWAAEADRRSDEGRLNRLLRENPEKARELKALGRTGISADEYHEFKNKRSPLEAPLKPPTRDPSTPAPAPAPVPVPVPVPVQAVVVVQAAASCAHAPAREEPAPTQPPPPVALTQADRDALMLGIIEAYNRVLPELEVCKGLFASRERVLGRSIDKRMGADLERWERYFTLVRESDFIMGRSASRNGSRFRANFDWLVSEETINKFSEGKYLNHARAA